MITLSSAENALKSVYLGVVANQLNINANPLLGKIKQSTRDVFGKEIIKMAPWGINGGVGAGTETGVLPSAASNKYVQFKSDLKNLYGKIELSDKAIRASQSNVGAFVNLLNDEMEGLVKASSFNLGRMLHGDGTGVVATVTSFDTATKVVTCSTTGTSKVKNLIEGMVVDTYKAGAKVEALSGLRINFVNRATNTFTFDIPSGFSGAFAANDVLYVQGSKGNEITGLGTLFGAGTSLYGLSKANYSWLNPYKNTAGGEISDALLQSGIDFLEEQSGSTINYIACSTTVRRAYQEYMNCYRRNVDITDLQGGYKAITFNGIPLVADRFVADDTLMLLNTNDFTLHQLCDWEWLQGENGRILRQNAGYPTYSATLVKYADLICDRPNGQAKISGINATVANPFAVTVDIAGYVKAP
ncbi:MAG: phage major capsid protein [Clostridia bacterium]